MKLNRITTIVAALAAAFITTTAFAADDHKEHGAASGIPKDYPLKKCPVSGDGFDHGRPTKVTHEGTDVYLCCKDCLKDFNKEPGKYVKMVTDAKAKAKK